MLCPACKEDMVIVEYQGIELDMCASCHGVWFDAEELSLLCASAGVPGGAGDLDRQVSSRPRAASGQRRRCPRCSRKMERTEVAGKSGPVTLDRCRTGDGLWFDNDELPDILGLALPDDSPGLRSIKDFLGAFGQHGVNARTDGQREKAN